MWWLLTLYIAFPAFAANMAPVFAARMKWLPSLDVSVSEKYLGKNKTVRGFVVGIGVAIIVALLQYAIYLPFIHTWITACIFGALAGTGALIGDSIKSYFKRSLHIAPGRPFIPFDYIDYILGFLLFTYPFYPWTLVQSLFLLVIVCLLNPITNIIGYLLGIKKTYW